MYNNIIFSIAMSDVIQKRMIEIEITEHTLEDRLH